MAYVLVNSEPASSWQNQTDQFINGHDYPVVCNDYNTSGGDSGRVRLQFQTPSQRPVFVAINGVANSPSHHQYELLINEGRYGQLEFAADMARWRDIMNSVHPPPKLLSPRRLPDGTFEFILSGEDGYTYTIESTTNLQSWSIVETNLPLTPTGTVFRDLKAVGGGQRFYRAVLEE